MSELWGSKVTILKKKTKQGWKVNILRKFEVKYLNYEIKILIISVQIIGGKKIPPKNQNLAKSPNYEKMSKKCVKIYNLNMINAYDLFWYKWASIVTAMFQTLFSFSLSGFPHGRIMGSRCVTWLLLTLIRWLEQKHHDVALCVAVRSAWRSPSNWCIPNRTQVRTPGAHLLEPEVEQRLSRIRIIWTDEADLLFFPFIAANSEGEVRWIHESPSKTSKTSIKQLSASSRPFLSHEAMKSRRCFGWCLKNASSGFKLFLSQC